MHALMLHCCVMQDVDRGTAMNVSQATKPYADLNLFVANEAYSTQQVQDTPCLLPLIIHS